MVLHTVTALDTTSKENPKEVRFTHADKCIQIELFDLNNMETLSICTIDYDDFKDISRTISMLYENKSNG